VPQVLAPLLLLTGGLFFGTVIRGGLELAGRLSRGARLVPFVWLGWMTVWQAVTHPGLAQMFAAFFVGALIGFAAAHWWARRAPDEPTQPH
jgi:hypothetical protein